MQDANSISTPLSKSVKLPIPTGPMNTPTINAPYAKAISSLIYAALGAHPDIAFEIQHFSQFTMSYGPEHWTAVKHVFQYLKGTHDRSVQFKKDEGMDL